MNNTKVFLLFFISACTALFCFSFDELKYPHGKKADILSQLFGEGSSALSDMAVRKADVYYHGGVMNDECEETMLHLPNSENADEHSDEHEHVHDENCEHHEQSPTKRHDKGVCSIIGFASWLNSEIHPSGHKHLSGGRYEKEVLPWLWTALKTNDKNFEAYRTAAYWLAKRMKKPKEAEVLLKDAIKKYPDEPLLGLTLAEVYMAMKDQNNALKMLKTAEKSWRAKKNENPSDDIEWVGQEIYTYLAATYRINNETAKALTYYQQLAKIASTEYLRTLAEKRIRELQKSSKSTK